MKYNVMPALFLVQCGYLTTHLTGEVSNNSIRSYEGIDFVEFHGNMRALCKQ